MTILCSLCSILHLFLETVRTWSLFRQRRTGNGRQNSNGACGLLLQADGAGFPSVRFSRVHGAGFPGVRGVRRWISQRAGRSAWPRAQRHVPTEFTEFFFFFSEDVSKGGQHKSRCLRSSSAIMCALSSVRAHRLSLAPRVDTSLPQMDHRFFQKLRPKVTHLSVTSLPVSQFKTDTTCLYVRHVFLALSLTLLLEGLN